MMITKDIFTTMPVKNKTPDKNTKLLFELISYFNPSCITTDLNYKKGSDILIRMLEVSFESGTKPYEKKQIIQYIEILEHYIKIYDDKHDCKSEQKKTGVEVLVFLMGQHDLTQSDLKDEIGNQSTVSQVLNNKRNLSKNYIEALSKRFGVSPASFFDS